ncbi:MAG TPA: molybdopterin-dependent oxidoreductase [Acetobacteraceae bacterium]|jgi:DMSO/TMAO reductase YedYZ molybdopterin-dependent catalytic subunit
MNRRQLLTGLGGATLVTGSVNATEKPGWLSSVLPDGTREEATLEALPGKQKLIRLTDRPPNYESPIETFRTQVTPNDRFFIRYHLAGIPSMADLGKWSLTVGGEAADRQVTLNLDDLRGLPQVEVAAVCQCSGNRRGLSSPHVAGVEWGYGAMGCATWRGPRLKDLLGKSGVKASAVEVWLDGADGPVLPTTPDFHKSLPMDKAMSDDVIIATTMNGQPLPHLNGYPARIVVAGWTATYWMKHVTNIQVSTRPLDSFWMQKAYRVPSGMFPVDHPFTSQDNASTWPITDIVVNSLVADPLDGAHQPQAGFTVQGVAWDRGHGIKLVEVSLDGGKSWHPASLDNDNGRFAFRGFSLHTGKLSPGAYVVSSRATNNAGETQADKLKFNPAGYHNNVPQQIAVTVA